MELSEYNNDIQWRNLVLKQLENLTDKTESFVTHLHDFELRITRDLTKLEQTMVSKASHEEHGKILADIQSKVAEFERWKIDLDSDGGISGMKKWKDEDFRDWKKEVDTKLDKHQRFITIGATVFSIIQFVILFFKDAITKLFGG